MRFLILPTCFPRPESMGQGDIAVWTNWIREETDEIMKQLEEERDSRSDPDYPFNGTAKKCFPTFTRSAITATSSTNTKTTRK